MTHAYIQQVPLDKDIPYLSKSVAKNFAREYENGRLELFQRKLEGDKEILRQTKVLMAQLEGNKVGLESMQLLLRRNEEGLFSTSVSNIPSSEILANVEEAYTSYAEKVYAFEGELLALKATLKSYKSNPDGYYLDVLRFKYKAFQPNEEWMIVPERNRAHIHNPLSHTVGQMLGWFNAILFILATSFSAISWYSTRKDKKGVRGMVPA